jgi:hypothetical protein
MNVTPDKDEPIIPNATRYHGDWRFAVKNVSVVAPLEVYQAMAIRIKK